MCRLLEKYKGKYFNGYKIAVRENGKYYSPATGVCYDGPVEAVEEFKEGYPKLYFNREILAKGHRLFSEAMVGRTAAFDTLADALEAILHDEIDDDTILVVIRVRLTKDLMSGTYGSPSTRVVAGRHIKVLEECGLADDLARHLQRGDYL